MDNNLYNQRIAAKILSRISSLYMNQELDSKNLKGWGESLSVRLGPEVSALVFSCR